MLEHEFPAEESPELARWVRLLDDPGHAHNPLRPALAELLALCAAQQERLARLVRISDGYHDFSRSSNLSLSAQYARQLRRLEKITRISDHYQKGLHELSAALRDAALSDVLTGLYNRRYLMECLKQETECSARNARHYALGILDVDYFKSINDRFGHEAGDVVLCRIAKVIQSSIREGDLCGRWGGEEFLVVLPDTAQSCTLQVAERIRQDIAGLQIDFLGAAPLPHVTASVGLALHRPGEAYSVTLGRADAALRNAKVYGRNRVELG